MKPRFALTLSDTGIGLFHRSSGGWNGAGGVAFHQGELEGQMAILHSTAAELAGAGFLSALVLPDDQILYKSLPLESADDDGVRAALVGATPYDVADLVFDTHVTGDTVQVAVVARETLEEAEAFAVQHRFNPVCFIASPEAGWTARFGLTQAAALLLPEGETLVEDDLLYPRTTDATTSRIERRIAAPKAAQPPAPAENSGDDSVSANSPVAPAVPLAPLLPPETRPTFGTKRTSDASLSAKATPTNTVAPRISIVAAAATEKMPVRPLGAVGVTAAVAPALEAPLPEPDLPLPKSAKALKAPDRRVEISHNVATTTVVAPLPPANEAEALTVFGARNQDVNVNAPRFTGILLTALLLALMAGAAVWSAFYMSDRAAVVPETPPVELAPRVVAPDVLASLPTPAVGSAPNLGTQPGSALTGALAPTRPTAPGRDIEIQQQVEIPARLAAPAETAPATVPAPAPQQEIVARAAPLPDVQATLLAPQGGLPRDPREAALTTYAVHGIWSLPPARSVPPLQDSTDEIYLAALDPATPSTDALALVQPAPDTPLAVQPPPPPQGQVFVLDENGRVIPSPEGTLSPTGVMVFAGQPPIVPPRRPGSEAPETVQPAQDDTRALLEGKRPKARPTDLSEQAERALGGGYSRSELAQFRPRPRPQSVQEAAAAAAPADGATSGSQLAASPKPKDRPEALARSVREAQSAPVATAVPAAAAAPTPRLPTSASVAKQATVDNAINLRRVNLIGVFGDAGGRRALVRLPSGRFVKVQVGDRLDGGQVAAISDDSLRYIKNGKNVVLDIAG